MSIDEAYLDVTENKLGLSSAVKIAKLIQYDIWNELHLTASAGVSYNKFLAKIASDMEKPHGLTLILPEEAVGILASLPIEKFHGVGKKTVKRLHDMGVYTGQDLLDVSEMVLIDTFGRFGFDLYRKARGISNSPVKADRVRKSIGKEKTYRKLLYRDEDVLKELTSLCQRVAGSLERNGKKGRTIVLKVRYGDFSTLTKRHSLDEYTDQLDIIEKEVRQLIEEIGQVEKGIRLLGVTVTNFQAWVLWEWEGLNYRRVCYQFLSLQKVSQIVGTSSNRKLKEHIRVKPANLLTCWFLYFKKLFNICLIYANHGVNG